MKDVPSFVMVTLALGITAPVASLTVPKSAPVSTWAAAYCSTKHTRSRRAPVDKTRRGLSNRIMAVLLSGTLFWMGEGQTPDPTQQAADETCLRPEETLDPWLRSSGPCTHTALIPLCISFVKQ